MTDFSMSSVGGGGAFYPQQPVEEFLYCRQGKMGTIFELDNHESDFIRRKANNTKLISVLEKEEITAEKEIARPCAADT